MAELIVRPATESDLAEANALLVETWHATYDGIYGPEKVTDITGRWHSVEALQQRLATAGDDFRVAERGDDIVGTICVLRRNREAALLTFLYVRPDAQGSGVGQTLLDAAMDALPADAAMTLEVERANGRAVAFYERNGFAVAGEGADCGGQGDGIPHLIMMRPVTA